MQTTTLLTGTWNKGRQNANKGKRLPPEPLTQAEVHELLKRCSDCPTGLRNKALLVLLWRCGLRISEALALQPKDIDRDAGTVNVRHGKGNKQRIVGIDHGTLAVIDLWLAKRRELGHSGNRTILCTLAGEPLQASYVRNLCKRLAREAGIEKRCNPHSLRHTLASELRQEGTDIGVISKQLGHSSIVTTVHYLDHLAPAAVIQTMQNRKPW